MTILECIGQPSNTRLCPMCGNGIHRGDKQFCSMPCKWQAEKEAEQDHKLDLLRDGDDN